MGGRELDDAVGVSEVGLMGFCFYWCCYMVIDKVRVLVLKFSKFKCLSLLLNFLYVNFDL